MRRCSTEIARSMRAALNRTPIENAYYALCCIRTEEIEAVFERFNRTFEDSQTASKLVVIKTKGGE